nr:MAG TPA: hypothetical protein [Caudoviricetes sp.]
MTRPITSSAPFRFKTLAQASRVAPVVKMSSQRCLYLIQSNDSRDFEHPRVHFNRCCTDWLSS